MQLIRFLNQFSKQRLSWLLLLISTIIFECCALFFQHVLDLNPCVMCIYERISMVGIIGAALIGLIAPKYKSLRWLAMTIWAISAGKGLLLAQQHVEYQLHPSPFATCDIFVTLPSWLPLNHWFPWMFEAYGECSDITWMFMGLTMPQWLVIVFIGNLVALMAVIISQFFSKR